MNMKNSSTKINANGVPVGYYFRRASAARYYGISLRTLGEFQRRRILFLPNPPNRQTWENRLKNKKGHTNGLF
jgi:hypothetical protein